MEPSAAITTAVAAPSESQRAALINLLADDDPDIYHAIRDKILSFGETARDWLRPHALSGDPLLRRRVQEIIRHFDRQAADNRFLSFCLRQGEDCDLEQGAWLLAQTQYPEINTEAYSALLDNFAGELRLRIEPHKRGRQILEAMSEYIRGELGFKGNEQNYYDPENSYLNRVLDRRTGNPINICVVYLLLARRLKLPMTGIGFPGHFLCRYQTSSDEIYIDAFHSGKLLTKADCIHHLVRGNYDLHEHYLAPVSTRRILARSCGSLHQIYARLGHKEEITRFQRYLVALAR
jgi:regulator of sirC expression with transglutaminase-like and TPR domain